VRAFFSWPTTTGPRYAGVGTGHCARPYGVWRLMNAARPKSVPGTGRSSLVETRLQHFTPSANSVQPNHIIRVPLFKGCFGVSSVCIPSRPSSTASLLPATMPFATGPELAFAEARASLILGSLR